MLPLVSMLSQHKKKFEVWLEDWPGAEHDWKVKFLNELSPVRFARVTWILRSHKRWPKKKAGHHSPKKNSLLFFLSLFPSVRKILSFDTVILGWTSGRAFWPTLANRLSRRIIAVPHGFGIYREFALPGRKVFADRNVFDEYIVNTVTTKDYLVAGGMSESNISVLGNLRYTPFWHRQLRQRISGLSSRQTGTARTRITFFLPNPNPRVDWREVHKVVSSLFFSSFEVVLVPHIRPRREDSDSSLLDDFLSTQTRSGFVIDAKQPVEHLVLETDVVLFSGTSIGLVGLLEGIPTYHLDFLIGARTIFDSLQHAHISSFGHLTLLLEALSADNQSTASRGGLSKQTERWFQENIWGEGKTDDGYRRILKM